MPEKTKQNETDEQEKTIKESRENEDEGSWSRDQREKSYYYDDSYGYEIYNPDDDDEDDESED